MPIVHWTTRLHAMIPHSSWPAVMGISTTNGLVLPQTSLSEQISQSQEDRVQSGLGPACGLPLNVLRCLAFEINHQESRTDTLYLLEEREDDFQSGNLPEGWV